MIDRVRVVHKFDWGQTPAGKRYATCSCGWRAPTRSKLTHGISDVRDHLAAIKAQCAAQGWQWWMLGRDSLVTETEADTPTTESVDQAAGIG
jgi:hypothetical protein